jgi:two-component system, cell cycle response regulator
MKDKTILVVEDNQLNMKLVRTLLRKDDFRVVEAENAERGLDLAREEKPDLILMDIQLPGMDGLSAVKILKADPVLKRTPVAALTSYAMEGDVEKAREAGCDGYISKPIDTRGFMETVRSFLGNGPPPISPRGQGGKYKKKILIVDDEPRNVKLLEAMLPSSQYEVNRAHEASQGLEQALQIIPDLILLDVMMPGMNGYEVTRKLKADPATKEIPVILVTALSEEADKIKGLQAGADDFINKPVQKVELLARTRSLIQLKELREQSQARQQILEQFMGSSRTPGEGAKTSPPQAVLVVEDNPRDAKLILHSLQSLPLRLELVGSGEEALSRVESGEVDLILLDILLPGRDGFKVCQHLKENGPTKNIPVLLVTCLSDLESKMKGLSNGADDFLVKPFIPLELQSRVRALLQKKTYLDRLDRCQEWAFFEALTDPITGLYNRLFLNHFLGLEIKRSLRQKYPASLLLAAVEGFGTGIDPGGLPGEDRIRKDFARFLKANIREVDLLGHYAENTYFVVMPYTEESGAMKVAERIQDGLKNHPFLREIPGSPSTLTVSVGIAQYSSPEMGVEEWTRNAEEALCRSQGKGKSTYPALAGDSPRAGEKKGG